MKHRYMLTYFLWLTGMLVALSGCAGSTQAQGQTPPARIASPSAPTAVETPALPVKQLQPEGTVPATCPATTIYQGGPNRGAGLDGTPWIQAQPAASNIFAYLFYARTGNVKQGSYRFIHTGGGWDDGTNTKILWIITHPQAASPLSIDGANLSDATKTFHQSIDGVHEIPSIVVIPHAGCWRLQITSGSAHGTIVLWAVGKD